MQTTEQKIEIRGRPVCKREFFQPLFILKTPGKYEISQEFMLLYWTHVHGKYNVSYER